MSERRKIGDVYLSTQRLLIADPDTIHTEWRNDLFTEAHPQNSVSIGGAMWATHAPGSHGGRLGRQFADARCDAVSVKAEGQRAEVYTETDATGRVRKIEIVILG